MVSIYAMPNRFRYLETHYIENWEDQCKIQFIIYWTQLVPVKYLTRLKLGLNHLNEHKFRHNLNPLCS